MASNALSNRRKFLDRPKVCKTPPNPGRCHPPPPPVETTCHIGPEHPEVEFEGDVDVDFWALNENYPEDQIVGCVCTASAGGLECPVIQNGPMVYGEYHAPGQPGTHTMQAVFTWPDSSTCISQSSVIEEEEPE